MPDLVTPEEEMSPVPDHSNDSGYGTQDSTPVDVNADQDSFHDKEQTGDPGPSPRKGPKQCPLSEKIS